MKKQFFSIVALVLFGVLSASAQNTPEPVKTISGGVVNGKAEVLAKPVYPAAARAVRASGAVNVKILIDEEGKVVSAEAVSGHPLLRAASVEAALQSKFNPTFLSGQVVKVMGVLVYNFIPDAPSSWFKTGYNLASVQHAGSLIHLNTNSIAQLFQPDWSMEYEQLQKLAQIKQAETPPDFVAERKIEETTEKNADGTVVKKTVVEKVAKAELENNPEQVTVSQSLIAALQSRLGSDELSLWQFNTGVSLSFAVSKLRYTNERQRVLDALRQQISSAPEKVSPEFLAELQALLPLLEKMKLTPEEQEQMRQTMSKLLRN